MHSMLPITSLVFKVPLVRNKLYAVIWKEYQLHGITFSLRSTMMALFLWFGNNQFDYASRFGIFVFWHVAAGIVSSIYKDPNGGTPVRGSPEIDKIRQHQNTTMPEGGFSESPIVIKIGNYLASVGQIIGSIFILSGDIRECMWVLLAIQIAPLCMTLVRKGIITNNVNHIIYMLAIAIPLFDINFVRFDLLLIPLNDSYVFLRFYIDLNKYLLWLIITLIMIKTNFETMSCIIS